VVIGAEGPIAIDYHPLHDHSDGAAGEKKGGTVTVGPEVNTEKTKSVLLPRHQNAGQNHDMKTGNRCFENVSSERLSTDGNKSKLL
jgi:hypothetical protein